MKYDYLKKALIKTGIICLVILLITGGITYFTMYYDETLEAETAKLKSDTASFDTQFSVTQNEVKEAQEALAFYHVYTTDETNKPDNFRRDYAKNLLANIKDQINLVELKFTMDQFQKKNAEALSKPHVSFYTSKVVVEVSANSDVDFYNLIEALSKSFPGSVGIVHYEIKRIVDLNEETEKKIDDKTLEKGLVAGKVEFEWGTILDNPEADDKTKAAPKPGMPNPMVVPHG